MGYDSSNFLKNNSTFCIYILFCCSKILFYLILMIVAKFTKSKRIKKAVKRWKFFRLIGELIGVCLETYMEILITGFMSARSNLWGKAGDVLGNIFAYFALSIVLFTLPFLSCFTTLTELEKIESKSIKYICRSLYDGI